MFFSKKKKSRQEIKRNPLQNPKILEVNLIKDELRIAFDWNKNISVLVLVLFIVGVFIGEISYGLDWWEKQENIRAQSLADEVLKVSQEISKIKIKADEVLAYKDKSIELGRLLDNHVYFSNFFSWLEKKTLSTVSYSDFSGDTAGAYSLTAEALSYAEASWQVKAFLDDPLVKSAEVLNVSTLSAKDKGALAAKGVSFSLDLEVSPEIFKK